MERYQEIERTIIKNYRGRLWAPFIKALKEYELIKPNDRVCVCISGGKDSMLMAKLFQELKRHSKFNFDVKYIVMDPGYRKENLDKIKFNLELLGIPAEIYKSNIFEEKDINLKESQNNNIIRKKLKQRLTEEEFE